MESYEIDPVVGTLKYCGDCEIADMNQRCYSICGAFNQGKDDQKLDPVYENLGKGIVPVPVAPLFPDSWNITDDCAKKCNVLMNKQKILQFGENSCDHQAPYRPVIWGEAPHYFPKLFRQTRNKEQALQLCLQMCDGEGISLPEQCKMNCRLEEASVIESSPVNPPVNPSIIPEISSDYFPVWVVILICIILIVVIMQIKK